jgi:hypothetical protein
MTIVEDDIHAKEIVIGQDGKVFFVSNNGDYVSYIHCDSTSHNIKFNCGGIDMMSIDYYGVGVGGSRVSNCILSCESTNKAFRPPVMTTAQKNAITPSEGMMVFDTTLNKLCIYSGASWETITSV